MKNRTPVPSDLAAPNPAIPAFDPVPRKSPRHDGWTPERQRLFIQALAETGSVTVAARQVNMAHASVYALRLMPGAESFRAAWDAALACGVQVLRDEAFDRAMNGQLQPVFARGKLMGYRRVKSDRLLMYMLRHYGQDASGKRVTLNYFAAPQDVDAGRLQPAARQPAAIPATRQAALPAPDPAALIAGFAGVELDDEAQSTIIAALEAAAVRRRDVLPEDDRDVSYVAESDTATGFAGELEFAGDGYTTDLPPGESPWEALCDPDPLDQVAAATKPSAKRKRGAAH